MRVLWRWISARHLLHEGGRTLLVLAGVALGVGVFVAIRLANHSALASFAATVDAVAGRANLQVTADSRGFPEELLARIRAVPGVTAAAPVVQAYALADVGARQRDIVAASRGEGGFTETLLVLGVDPAAEGPFARTTEGGGLAAGLEALAFLADPGAIAVTRAFAERHGLAQGATLPLMVTGVPRRLRVGAILDAPGLQQAMAGNVALLSLPAAQALFSRAGRLDRVDLLVPAERREAVTAALRSFLPANARVALPETRSRQVENMVAAFGLNLTALSFIALFVAMFLIFNAVSMAVLRRRGEIGILRGLGVTRRQVVLLFLGEAALLGAIGGALGLAFGTLLARGALGAVARTISTLYLQVHARDLALDPGIYAGGLALGVGIALLAALAPALEASLTPPNAAMRQGMLLEAQPLPLGRITLAGILLLGAAALVAWLTVAQRRPAGGFVSAFLLLGGFSLIAPGFTLLGERLAAPIVGRFGPIEAVLGARYLREAVARTSVVVAALMVSVGMTIGLSVMVASFRRTVDVWVNQTIRGDLYIEPVGRRVTGSATALPGRVLAATRGLPGVAAVDTYRGLEIEVGGRMAHLAGIEFAVQRDRGRLLFMDGSAPEVLARALREGGLIASESFAFRHGVRAGDRVPLDTPTGRVELPVSGVFYDYTTDAGLLMLDRARYAQLWGEDRTESIALYLEPGARWEDARAELLQRAGPTALNVMPDQALRSRILTIFDQTFQITYALHAIAIVVAVLGVVSTLTALILQRAREIGVLRGVGALRGQVRRMVLVESGLLGLIGSLLGCACGVCLALLLTYVINKQFFGWTIRLTVDPWLFVQATALMVATAFLAGLGPARLAAGRAAAEAMRAD